jgi:non-ribosomal peptide synthetase component F
MGERLAGLAAARPGATALSVAGGPSLSFGAWERRSNAGARGLAERGVGPGDRVVLLFDRRHWTDLAVAYLAARKAGAAAVPAAPGLAPGDLARTLVACQPAAVVAGPGSVLPPGFGPVAVGELIDGHSTEAFFPPGSGGPAEVLYSSGAMRPARPRASTERDLVDRWGFADVARLSARPGVEGREPTMLVHAFPMGSAAASTALMVPLFPGLGAVTAVPRADGDDFWAVVAEHDPAAVGLPASLAARLDPAGRHRFLDLSGLRLVIVSGRPPAALLRRLTATLPGAAVTTEGQPRSAKMPARRAEATAAPVSPSQEGMVWHEQFVPGSFNISPLVRRYRGPLDVKAMESALGEMMARHASLRATFRIAGGRAVQLVGPPVPLRLGVVDLSGGDPAAALAVVRRMVADGRRRPVDLVTGPLFQPTLIRLGAQDHVLLIRVHHAVFDDWSVGPFRRELSALYQAFAAGEPSPLPRLAVQFDEVCRRQRAALAATVGEAERDFWEAELAGAPTSTQLPIDDPARPQGSALAPTAPITVTVDPAVAAGLRALARRERVTLFMVMAAAFGVVMQRYTAQDDLVISTLVANRNRPLVEGMIGCFSKKVLVRLRLSGDPTFSELVRRTRDAVLKAMAHGESAYEAVLQANLGPAAAVHGLTPQVGVKFQAAVRVTERVRLPGLTASPLPPVTEPLPHFLAGPAGQAGAAGRAAGAGSEAPWGAGLYLSTFLGLSVVDGDDGLALVTEGVFHPPAVARLLGCFATVLAQVADSGSGPVSELSILDGTARAELSRLSQGPDIEVTESGVHHAVAGWARRAPDRPAVRGAQGDLTYAELDSAAGRQAERLRRAGVGPGKVVAVLVGPGVDAVTAVLAIWKAGAAVVGLDPADRVERRAAVVTDAGARVILAGEGLGADLGRRCPFAPVLELAGAWSEPAAEGPGPGDSGGLGGAGDAGGGGEGAVGGDDIGGGVGGPEAVVVDVPGSRTAPGFGDLAWVDYGSGSGARDHGVAISHAALVAAVAGRHQRWGPHPAGTSAGLRVVAAAHPADGGFVGVLAALAHGHHVHVLPADGPPEVVTALMASAAVDVLECTPPRLPELMAAGLQAALDARPPGGPVPTVVVASAEPPDEAWWPAGRRLTGARLHHLYAPAECAWAATAGVAGEGSERVNVGRPLANVTAQVLDDDLRPVPMGAIGELHVGGTGLAAGYHRRPDVDTGRFVADPARPGHRLWRSGLRARLLPDGSIEALGRRADTVDVGGFVVEPGRIERALAGGPGLAQVAVVAQPDYQGDRRLVAYVVADGRSPAPTLARLRRHLWARLPGYAWPACLCLVDSLPENIGTGLADLLPVDADLDGAAGANSPTETLLRDLWTEAGGEAATGGTGNYWQSFSFLDALAAAAALGVAVDPQQVTRNRTLQTLAADIDAGATAHRRFGGVAGA